MTDITPTTEQIRFAFIDREDFEAQVGGVERPTDEESGDAFDRWLTAHDARIAREAAEKAWDEGFTRGFYSGQSMRSDADASESPVENPYRADRLRAEREGAEEGGAR